LKGEKMKIIRFSHEYSKLKKNCFTTIRKNTKYYQDGEIYKIVTPKQKFMARIAGRKETKKQWITEEIAWMDADCSREKLIKMLETWYGKKFNDFIFIFLRKVR
jgi:hypothetical protein